MRQKIANLNVFDLLMHLFRKAALSAPNISYISAQVWEIFAKLVCDNKVYY